MSVWDGYRGECHCACVQWCNGMSLTCYPVPCENKCLMLCVQDLPKEAGAVSLCRLTRVSRSPSVAHAPLL